MRFKPHVSIGVISKRKKKRMSLHPHPRREHSLLRPRNRLDTLCNESRHGESARFNGLLPK